jgi:hypothetical protein
MGNTNISRLEGRHKKRDVKIFFAEVNFDEIATSAEVYQFADMPDECIILSAVYFPIVTNDAGTSMAFDLGLNGGDELIDGGDGLTAAGTDVPSTTVPLHVPTGGVLTFLPTYGGTAAAAGKVFIYVEYVEYRQCTGELTNFVA